MHVAGETNLMTHADLSDVNKLRELFDAFEQKRDIYHLLERCISADGVNIFIGRESGYDALGDCSLVTAPYELRCDIKITQRGLESASLRHQNTAQLS